METLNRKWVFRSERSNQLLLVSADVYCCFRFCPTTNPAPYVVVVVVVVVATTNTNTNYNITTTSTAPVTTATTHFDYLFCASGKIHGYR